jgi:heat shock protein HtpX
VRNGGYRTVYRLLGAQPIDPDDAYHLMFRRVVEEISVAAGHTDITCAIIPLRAMNAFALHDPSGNAIVGVTEGMLGRLSRPQLSAVVAHEMAHIVNGDAGLKTTAAAMVSVLTGCAKALGSIAQGHRAPVVVMAVYAIVALSQKLVALLTLGLSRESEWRADAAAVLYCRDPLSLAQALSIASRAWRGGGDLYETYENLFIISPTDDGSSAERTTFSALFATHPPTSSRISRLLAMGNATVASVISPAVTDAQSRVAQLTVDAQPRWSLYAEGGWSPYISAVDLVARRPGADAFVRREGTDRVLTLSDEPLLLSFFTRRKTGGEGICPRCLIPLVRGHYEGAPLMMCSSCGGTLLAQHVLPRVIAREECGFSAEVISAAEKVIAESNRLFCGKTPNFSHHAPCPICGQRMITHFYTAAYRLEVDTCHECKVTWFDKDELHIVEYIAQRSDTNG